MTLSVYDAAAEVPEGVALVAEGQALTWRALAERVRQTAAWLTREGVSSDERVAFVAAPSVDAIVLGHALIAKGICAVPIDPRLGAHERAVLVEELAPLRFVTPPVGPLGAPAPQAAEVARQTAPERTLAILHTSGSSGRPKGVVLSRRAFAAAAAGSAEILGWRDDDRWLLALPFAHVGGLSVLSRCLIARRTVVVCDGAGVAFDAAAAHATMVRERVTLASFVPAQLRRLLDLGVPAPSSLRAVLLGGAAAPSALVDEATARGYPVLPTYGLTEACSQVTTRRPGVPSRGPRDCGPPLPGVRVRIVDGAVEIAGPTLLDRYVPEAVHPSPLSDGWLRTGDSGFVDEAGHLHVLGRRDRMIVTGGENVAPVEVEEALARCAGIAAACVYGVPDEVYGEVVAAALVPVGEAVEDEALRAALGPLLGRFKRPRRIAWVAALATTAAGKVDPKGVAEAAAPSLRRLDWTG